MIGTNSEKPQKYKLIIAYVAKGNEGKIVKKLT